MKTKIEVKNRKEAKIISLALEDIETRALVIVMGQLLALKTDRERVRVLSWVSDKLDDESSGENEIQNHD